MIDGAMNWADYSILVLIAISTGVSLLRGFTKEALSLTSWVAALWVALAFSGELAGLLETWISIPSVRTAVAFALLFFVVLIAGGLVNHLIGQLVKKTGLSGTDRILGSIFGIARGIVIVAVIVLLAGLTKVPEDPWWRESQLINHFEEIAVWMTGFLPPEVAQNVAYD